MTPFFILSSGPFNMMSDKGRVITKKGSNKVAFFFFGIKKFSIASIYATGDALSLAALLLGL